MPATDTSQAVVEQLEAGLEAQRAQLRDLAMMGTVITSIHEIDAVLSVVMDMAVRLVDGEVGLIMIDGADGLKQKVSWGLQEEFVKTLRYKDDMDLATYCFEQREAVLLEDLDLTTDTGVKIQSLIASPIQTSEKCLGIITIINRSDGANFTQVDVETLNMLLNFVAVAIDNMRMMERQLEQQKIQQELAIAKQVQEAILPPSISPVPGVDIGAIYFPAREVGGDFYDLITLGERQFLVVLGDVSNKGVPAALVMSATSAIIDSIVEMEPTISVSGLAGRLNDLLSREVIREREMFVTLFFARFDLEAGEITYCNGGHIPGLFWDEAENKIVELPEGGPIVGQFPGITFKEGRRPLRSGDKLFLFTDGLTEATDVNGQLFGRERVEQVFSVEQGLSPKEFCHKVKDWVESFQRGADQDAQDDFTIMQLTVE